MINGQVSIPYGLTSTSVDNNTELTVAANLANFKVFTTPHTFGCQDAYKALTCAENFPLCAPQNTLGVCKGVCKQVALLCGLNATHTDFLDCFSQDAAGWDSTGLCSRQFGGSSNTSSTGIDTSAASHPNVSFSTPIIFLLWISSLVGLLFRPIV